VLAFVVLLSTLYSHFSKHLILAKIKFMKKPEIVIYLAKEK